MRRSRDHRLAVLAPAGLLGQLAERGDRDGVLDEHAVLDGLPVGVEHQPARLAFVAVRTDVDAAVAARLGRDDSGELLAVAAVHHCDFGHSP